MVLQISVHIGLLLAAAVLESYGQDNSRDPCSYYATLTNRWRDPRKEADPNHCDDDTMLTEGWYILVLDREAAIIPTQCMQDNVCGAKVPLHIDLEGQEEPEVGQNITASLCGSYNVLDTIDCCVQRQPVIIKHCTDGFIYFLKPQKVCPVAICATKMGDVIPKQYLAQQGDRPRSLPPLETKEATSTSVSESLLTSSSSGTLSAMPQEITRTLGSIPDESSTALALTGEPAVSGTGIWPAAAPDAYTTVASPDDGNVTDSVVEGRGDNAENASSALPEVSSALELAENSTNTQPLKLDNSSVSQNDTEAYPGIAVDFSRTTEVLTSSHSLQTTSFTPSTSPRLTSHLLTGSTSSVGWTSDVLQSTKVTLHPTSGPLAPANEGTRFVVKGPYEESLFRNTLLHLLFILPLKLPDGDRNISDFSITYELYPNNLTLVDVYIMDPATNETVPAIYILGAINKTTLADQLFLINLTLVDMCATVDQCGDPNIHSSRSEDTEEKSLFAENQPLFIAVIVIAALCLLLLLLGLLFSRFRKQGTWVLTDHEKDPVPLAIESPMTDNQITHSENQDVVLTANGAHPHGLTADQVIAADEENGWVVPLDQAPPVTAGFANQTEDTQF